jgi:hypothetical protein
MEQTPRWALKRRWVPNTSSYSDMDEIFTWLVCAKWARLSLAVQSLNRTSFEMSGITM